MKETVKNMKKDRNFFVTLLDHIESIFIQGCEENIKMGEQINKMVQNRVDILISKVYERQIIARHLLLLFLGFWS